MPSTAPTLPAVSASQAFTSSSDSLDSWEEPHPGLRRPYPLGTGLGLVDRGAPGGRMDGMAAKQTRSYTRVRPGLPRRSAQHHTSAGPLLHPPQTNLSRSDTTWFSSVQNEPAPAVSLSDDAAESPTISQLPAGEHGPESNNIAEIRPQPAALTESPTPGPSSSRRLDADGDVAAMSEPFAEYDQHGSLNDVYGWDAELDRQMEAGPRPPIHADAPCSCDLDYTYRRKVGGKRSLLHRVFSLGSSSTLDDTSIQVRRSASSST